MKCINAIARLSITILALGMLIFSSGEVKAQNVQSIFAGNKYISYSPDGNAFTVGYQDKSIEMHNYSYMGYVCMQNGIIGPPELSKGEHYYLGLLMGKVPVAYWKLEHPKAACIHSSPHFNLSQFALDRMGAVIQNCWKPYNVGWVSYCAYCGEKIFPTYVYMTVNMASSLAYLPSGIVGANYFYLCPNDNSLENTGSINHKCKLISENRYNVHYNPGAMGISGSMATEQFYYNNATVYEGVEIIPQEKIGKCQFSRIGYMFEGWSLTEGGPVQIKDEEDWLSIQNRARAENFENDYVIELYAVWKPISSKLKIDYNTGHVGSEYGPLIKEGDYGYELELEIPIFDSYFVSFETDGGYFSNAEDGKKEAKREFSEWKTGLEFYGKLTGNTYKYLSTENDSTDSIKAMYSVSSIYLPVPRKDGYSFEGWYEGDTLVGNGGEMYTPRGNETLKAKWTEVKLVLTTEPNYSDSANEGKGAANLDWIYSEAKEDSTFRVYRSTDNVLWDVVGETGNISELEGREIVFTKENASSLNIESNGVYEVVLAGAEGGAYGSFSGGKGGQVVLKLWLNQGDILTFEIGESGAGYSGNDIYGQGLKSTYNGGAGDGGTGFGGAGGGGSTSIYITDSAGNKKLVAVSGGGGGASIYGKGGEGGSFSKTLEKGGNNDGKPSSVSLINTTQTSEYSCGGGGGYYPGKPGVVVFEKHVHDKSSSICGYHTHSGNSNGGGGCYTVRHTQTQNKAYAISCYSSGGTGSYRCGNVGCGNTGTISGMSHYGWYDGGWHNTGWSGYLHCPRCGNNNGRLSSDGQTSGTHYENKTVITYSLGCGKQNGFNCTNAMPTTDYIKEETSNISGGGSNWVNLLLEDHRIISYQYNDESCFGVNSGDGQVTIKYLVTNCTDETYMEGVAATDLEKPDEIFDYSVKAAGGNLVNIRWSKPKDHGSKYYFKVDSFSKYTGEYVITSNIQAQTLTTGVVGYYLLENELGNTVVNAVNGVFTDKNSINIIMGEEEVKYLHVAAVDKAGNVGNTLHIKIDSDDLDLCMLWNIKTNSLDLFGEDNIYQSAQNEYYIRADGKTPFYMKLTASMMGKPRLTYQINEGIFEENMGDIGSTTVHGNNTAFTVGNVLLKQRDISIISREGNMLLKYPYTEMIRQENGKGLELTQGFVVSQINDGKVCTVIPRAAATESKLSNGRVISNIEDDKTKAIKLIFDGEGPLITGADEFLSRNWLIDESENGEESKLNISISDLGSGIDADKFYITLENIDNACKYRWESKGSDSIEIAINQTMLEQVFYMGNFELIVHAEDRVGNISEQVIKGNGFDLITSVNRLLEPIDGKNIYARGESGKLNISTFGYADYVEVIFPDELSAFNVTYEYYDNPDYRKDEELQFMIPLYGLPDGNWSFEITVIAHKADSIIVNKPRINVIDVSGTVLDELRTTLR